MIKGTGHVRENIKMQLFKYTFKIKFRFTWNYLYKELNLLEKIVPQELSALEYKNLYFKIAYQRINLLLIL